MNYLLDDLMGFEKTANAAWRKPASPSTKEEYETERKKLRKNLIRSAVGATTGLALSRIPYGKITDQAKRRDWEKVVKNSTPENFEAIRDKHSIFSRRMNDVAMYAPLPGKMITAIGAGNLMNNAYRAAHLKLKYGKRFDGMQDQEKTAMTEEEQNELENYYNLHKEDLSKQDQIAAVWRKLNPPPTLAEAKKRYEESLIYRKNEKKLARKLVAAGATSAYGIPRLTRVLPDQVVGKHGQRISNANSLLRKGGKVVALSGLALSGLSNIQDRAESKSYIAALERDRAQEQEKTAASNLKEGGLMTAGGIGLTAASLYGSLALQKRLKEKYGDIDGVNETSFLSGIGNDKASNRIYPTKEQRERAEKFRKSFNRLNFGSRVGFGVGSGLAVGGASMLADAVSRR